MKLHASTHPPSQSISFLVYLREFRKVKGPHIIIVPKSTLGNWCRELARWAPCMKVLRLQGPKEERQALVKDHLLTGTYDVVVTSFETVIIERAALRKFSWAVLILDEAHRIKNEKSSLSRELRLLETQSRLLLTGTPLQNNLHELWALLNFLLPDVFSSAEDFDAWFSSDGEGGVQQTAVKKLHAILKPFLLRRLKADVEHSLKPKIETKLYIGMTAMQKEWYRNLLSKDVTALNSIGGADRVRLLNTLMQLRKVCNHPYLFEGAEPGPPYSNGPHLYENAGKMVLLQKLLPKLKSQGSRVLIFSQMTRMLDILEDYFLASGTQYCRIDGNTKSVDRDAAMDAFNEDGSEKFVFLLSTRAGGLGINLYTADVVVLYDSDWNPQMDLQAMDRAHRIGQKKQVRVFRFITENTVEEKIIERAERKLYLDAVVVQQGRLAEKNASLSKDELMSMVRFGADQIFRSKDATLTDDDIDAILARGEEKTKSMSDKIQRDMSHSLSNFSLSDTWQSSFTAGDSKEGGAAAAAPKMAFIDLPQRERKKNYDIDAAYQAMMGTAPSGRRKGTPHRLAKPPPMADHQFYNRQRITELYDKEDKILRARRDASKRLTELKAENAKNRRRWAKIRIAELQREAGGGDGGDEGGAAPTPSASDAGDDDEDTSNEPVGRAALRAKAEAEYDAEHTLPEMLKLEQGLEDLPTGLEEEEEEERKALLEEGFTTWSKKDFRAYISALERFGREARALVLAEVAEVTEKPLEAVEVYHSAFMARYKEIDGYRRYLDRIEKGEEKLRRRQRIEAEVASKIARHKDPYSSLTLDYTGVSWRGGSSGYTPEEDRLLLCLMNELGYGEWDALRVQVRQAYAFRFDWFIKSRTPEELARRCETLIRMVERENADLRGEKLPVNRKAVGGGKRSGSGGGGAGRSRSKRARGE